MEDLSQYVLPATAGFALIGLLLVLIMYQRGRAAKSGKKKPKNVVELECSVCHQPLVINVAELTPLSGAESALVVSERPDVSGRKMADYRCPYCDADHTFAVDVRPPQWIMANAFFGHSKTTHCNQCRKPLLRPSWPAGTYDQKLSDAPLQPDHGLICSRCGANCCVACVRDATRGRTKDGSSLCPRCFRGPVDKVFHF